MPERRPVVPILMYHRIGRRNRRSIVPSHYVSPERFERQLGALARLGYTPISLRRMREGFIGGAELPAKPVVLTFDDAYESFHSLAMPALERRGMTATVFAVAGLIGGQNEWDLAKGDVPEPLMSADQIRDAASRGFEVGSHGLTHANLAEVGCDVAEIEIFESRQKLQDALRGPVEWFCYPYGACTDKVKSIVAEAGYLGACATGKFGNTAKTDPFALGRLNVRSTTSIPQFAFKLFRAMRRPG